MNITIKSPYKAHVPDKLPLEKDFSKIENLADEALQSVKELQNLVHKLKVDGLFTSVLTAKEAIYSSRIEGVNVNLLEFLAFDQSDIDTAMSSDLRETSNCRRALVKGIAEIDKSKLSLFFLRFLHEELMNGFPTKLPGSFREQQNWIGSGGGIQNAIYIPPNPHILPECLDNLVDFINLHDTLNPLIKVAIIHAQFEIIHPFIDGNGRVGRLLIPLFLKMQGVTEYLPFYMSEYLYNNRPNYYEILLGVTKFNDWNSWLEFFITGISVQAKADIVLINKLNNLYQEIVSKVSQSDFIDILFDQPVNHMFALQNYINVCEFADDLPKFWKLDLLHRINSSDISSGLGDVYKFSKLIEIIDS